MRFKYLHIFFLVEVRHWRSVQYYVCLSRFFGGASLDDDDGEERSVIKSRAPSAYKAFVEVHSHSLALRMS